MHKEDGAGRVRLPPPALPAARCREPLYLRARFNMPDWRDHRPGGGEIGAVSLFFSFFFFFTACRRLYSNVVFVITRGGFCTGATSPSCERSDVKVDVA